MGAPRVLEAGVTREERPKNKNIKRKRPTNKPKRKKRKKRNQPTEKRKPKIITKKPAAPKEPEMKNKQTLKTKTKKQTKSSSPNRTNQIPVWSQTSTCSPSLLRHQIGTQPGASQPQQGGPYSTPGCRARAPHCGGGWWPERKKRMCQPPSLYPLPWASQDRAQPAVEGAGSELPTKYSFPEGERERA